jgi:hypothetical protein
MGAGLMATNPEKIRAALHRDSISSTITGSSDPGSAVHWADFRLKMVEEHAKYLLEPGST